jgi:acyl-[acyl-carrier-protein]-phospholipid O-acyltransferase/long-chain-fatty-acid--[acyl-carrier-protein] ligase
VPDTRKGERILLYTQQKNATRSDFISFARARHASELMIPAEVIFMEKLPLLGSGKVDYMTLTQIGKDHAAQTQRQPAPVA